MVFTPNSESALPPPDALILSPLDWEHINLTGDYVWRQSKRVAQGKFRPPQLFGEV